MRLFVSVGTDVHPFDRLVDWADRWAESHPDDEVLVQYGTSRVPRRAEGTQLLARDEMQEALASADLVIVSCGPGGVMDARRHGRLPVVVARRRDLGEHVDDHQVTFAAHLDSVGLARSVRNEKDLRELLHTARTDPEHFSVVPDGSQPVGIAEVARLVDGLVNGGF